MIITYIHSKSPEDALRVQLRCGNFAAAINRSGWHSANLLCLDSFIQNTLTAQEICEASDLLVVHRYLYGPVLQAVAYWKARGKKVVVDFDQAINYLPPDIPSHAFQTHGNLLKAAGCAGREHERSVESMPLDQFKWGLGLIDAAIVSSMRLVVDWSPFTNVYEIPDFLNTDQYPAFKRAHEKIWVGLANEARMSSIRNSGLLTALESICNMRPEVQLVLGDRDDHAVLDIQPSQLVIRSSCRLDEWAEILLKLDIGLAPIYGDYDLRLGRINLLEFMISKTPWIASNQPAFREFSRFGRLVQNTSTAWESAILEMLDNLDVFQQRATRESFLFALSQDVNENIDKVLKPLTYILSQVK